MSKSSLAFYMGGVQTGWGLGWGRGVETGTVGQLRHTPHPPKPNHAEENPLPIHQVKEPFISLVLLAQTDES